MEIAMEIDPELIAFFNEIINNNVNSDIYTILENIQCFYDIPKNIIRKGLIETKEMKTLSTFVEHFCNYCMILSLQEFEICSEFVRLVLIFIYYYLFDTCKLGINIKVDNFPNIFVKGCFKYFIINSPSNSYTIDCNECENCIMCIDCNNCKDCMNICNKSFETNSCFM